MRKTRAITIFWIVQPSGVLIPKQNSLAQNYLLWENKNPNGGDFKKMVKLF